MKCSFIVSAFDQPDHLMSLLYALKVQSEPDFEVIVCDNSPDQVNLRAMVEGGFQHEPRFLWTNTHKQGARECYASANIASQEARGDYLCFPSCDNYYVPRFLELLLGMGTDLVYADGIYDPRMGGQYGIFNQYPARFRMDKGGFIVRRELFTGFPPEDLVLADGIMIEALVASGATHAQAPGVLWVHN